MTKIKGKKILVITNIIPPYRVPLYNYLNKNLENLKVLFLSITEKNRNWNVNKNKMNFNYEILKGKRFELRKGHYTLHINSIINKLKEYNPDIIMLTGYDQPAYWFALNYAKKRKIKVVMWNESTLLSSKLQKGIFYKLKKLFLNKIDMFITSGSKASEYLRFFGISDNKIVTGCNGIDNEWFFKRIKEIKKSDQYKDLKKKYQNKKVLLFIGRLIKYKGLDIIFEILKEIDHSNVHLLILGNGPDKDCLMNLCKNMKLETISDFVGYVQRYELPKYFAISDIFIFPSLLEPWGFVLNEALACGVPSLASKYAGASYDLIKEGINGYLFDPNNKNEFKEKIKKIIKDDINRDNVSESVKNKSYKELGDKIIDSFIL